MIYILFRGWPTELDKWKKLSNCHNRRLQLFYRLRDLPAYYTRFCYFIVFVGSFSREWCRKGIGKGGRKFTKVKVKYVKITCLYIYTPANTLLCGWINFNSYVSRFCWPRRIAGPGKTWANWHLSVGETPPWHRARVYLLLS